MKRGFTLIELLAVIVILAIIALIATPIVLNIIEESRENADLRSAEMYLDAVEISIATSTLNDKKIKDGTYNILENGNICLEYTDNKCTNELKVEVDGETPSVGSMITISSGQITNVSLKLNNKKISKNNKGQLVYSNLKYKIGEEVTFDPGDGDRTWNIIEIDSDTVTLMLTENLGSTVAWTTTDSSNGNWFTPKDILNYLNSLTINWDNVDPIESYNYEDTWGFLEIKKGVTTINTTEQIEGISKARILSVEELIELAMKENNNLTEENLREYIERNLDEIKIVLDSNVTLDNPSEITVDGIIDHMYWDECWGYQNLNEHAFLYMAITWLIKYKTIESTYDVSLPSYLYQNLYSNSNTSLPNGYWAVSAYTGTLSPYVVNHDGYLGNEYYSNSNRYGLRPVITIPKSKL